MIHTIDKRAAEKAAELLKYTNFKSCGIVLHGFSACELAYEVISNVNSYLESHFDHEICGFAMNRELPIFPPHFAIFNSLDLNTYYGTIISTDIPTWQASLSSPSKQRYLYIYDVARLQNVPPELIKKINESDVKIIPRSKIYADRLKKLGFSDIINVSVPYFDIARILEIL